MKILKAIVFLILFLIAAVLIAGLFIDKELNIEQNIVINKPKAEVFNFIKSLKNQDQFSVWAQMDPNMKKTFTGTDGTVGATQSWNGEKMGIGAQEIKAISEGKKIDFELRFETRMKATNTAFMQTDSIAPNQTKVSWGFVGKSEYPKNVSNLFMKGMLEEQLMTGLKNLKVLLEK